MNNHSLSNNSAKTLHRKKLLLTGRLQNYAHRVALKLITSNGRDKSSGLLNNTLNLLFHIRLTRRSWSLMLSRAQSWRILKDHAPKNRLKIGTRWSKTANTVITDTRKSLKKDSISRRDTRRWRSSQRLKSCFYSGITTRDSVTCNLGCHTSSGSRIEW